MSTSSAPASANIAAPAPAAGLRTRPLTDNPALAARAVEVLLSLRAFLPLDAADARCVLAYLREVSFQRGEVMLRAGDQASAAFMLLVLEGDVSVQGHIAGRTDDGPMAVVGPGAVLGEVSMFDGAPRSATCVAMSPVRAAGLARRGLELLLAEHPAVGARLMASMAQQMADRLRGVSEQLQIYGQLNDTLRDELDQLRLRLAM